MSLIHCGCSGDGGGSGGSDSRTLPHCVSSDPTEEGDKKDRKVGVVKFQSGQTY